MPAVEEITLRCRRLTLTLVPVAGGSVSSFLRDELPLFRACTPMARHQNEALALAGFPLVPFASRMQGNEFDWQGRRVTLAANMPGEPVAIHGQGWRRPWEAVLANAQTCRLKFEHPAGGSPDDIGDGWPWHYGAEQIFELSESALQITLTLTNLSDSDMPGGLGWHPYFYRGDARLTAQTQGRIRGAGDPAGDRRIPHGGFSAAEVASLHVDHGFYGWNGTAEIRWPARDACLTINAEPPLDFLVLYAPPGEDYFCVEPVSHLPDAANWQDDLPNGWRTIRPGETLAATIRVHTDG